MHKTCVNCSKKFKPNPRVKNQAYCNKEECQRARRAKRQKEKMVKDPDYRDNQKQCHKEWLTKHPEYYREYRKRHPDYVERIGFSSIGEMPAERFKNVTMQLFLKDGMDARETKSVRIYRDCRTWFDCNYYTAPYWTVGKTFLAECIALSVCKRNYKVLFTKVMDMINQLIAADADRTLHTKLDYYRKQQLLVLDELGYLSLNQQGSDLLFQVISGRHSVAATIITTNRTFKDWGEIFYNTTVASAVADRLTANSEVILLERSYRPELKKRKKTK